MRFPSVVNRSRHSKPIRSNERSITCVVALPQRCDLRGKVACAVFAAVLSGCSIVMGDIPPKEHPYSTAHDSGADASVESGTHDANDAASETSLEGGRGPDDGDASDVATDGSTDSAADASDALPDSPVPIDDGSASGDARTCSSASRRVFYRDADGDGHGDPNATLLACDPPSGWVPDGDDCHDGNPLVHPGQLGYYGNGYRPLGQANGLSFDYDCDGSETGAPGQLQAPPDCPGLGLVFCTGSGFDKNLGRESTSGVNPYCGSNAISTCIGGLLGCQASVQTSEQRYACN